MKKILLLLVTFVSVTIVNADNNLNSYIGVVDGGSGNGPIGNYSWKGTTSNLMTCFSFENGELANYTTLKFTISNLSGGMVRVGYYVGDTWTELGGFANNSEKTVNLTDITDRSKVTKIAFGGRSLDNDQTPGTVNIRNMYLTNDNGDKLYATYGTPANNASFNDYKWTATTNNLATLYSFNAGELAKYTKLTFTLSNKSDGAGNVRIGYYVGSNWTEFKNPDGNSGFGTTGDKVINLLEQDIDLSTVTKISFGGKTGTGSINIRNICLQNEALDREFTKDRKSTVCLPFALTDEEVEDAGTFYQLSDVSEGILTFREVNETEAYKPYVFVAKTTKPFTNLEKTAGYPVGDCMTTVGDYTFTGVLKSGKVPQNAYGYNALDGVFSQATSTNVNIDAFRAYITSGGGARAIRCVFGDEITEINEVKSQKKVEDDVLYNLSGQRVSANHKGIVIKNGRKYIMK